MELTLSARKAITKAQTQRWANASRSQKGKILDAVCEVTGWHRDHARKMMRQAGADLARGGPTPRSPRAVHLVYDEAVVGLLTKCWAALDGPSGKRLHPALPETLENLLRHKRLSEQECTLIDQVLAMSPATIDRRLAGARAGLETRRGMSHTRPGSMLKASIPMKTWREWSDTEPGFIQIDLVGHEGGDNNGPFFLTLNATDVATGWTETITVRSKGERIVATALAQLQLRFPFHIHGIHSDNGSEFINHHLQKWCRTRKITFTRGRASHKNDQAHIEQKNWSVVRRNVGYFRYDTPRELALLNNLWPLVSLQVNLFLPQQKLVSKTRTGAIVKKQHDQAQTPLRRLINHHADILDLHDRAGLERLLEDTDLVGLKYQIADLQGNLIESARQRGIVTRRQKTNAAYLNHPARINREMRAFQHESTNQTKRAS